MSDPRNGEAARGQGGSVNTNHPGSHPKVKRKASSRNNPKRVVLRAKARKVLPAPVLSAYDYGLWILPQVVRHQPSGGFRKVPPFQWKRFQTERPSLAQLVEWQEKYKPPMWAFIAGHKLFALDFDPEGGGTQTLARLGLRSSVHSSGGGGHVYVRVPPWAVATQTRGAPGSPFPGMEVKAAGNSLITFYGSNPDGEYVPAEERKVYTVEELPPKLQKHIRQPAQRKKKQKSSSGESNGGTGLWLPSTVQLALLKLGIEPKPDERNWAAPCPNHPDDNPSFAIGLGDQRLLVATCSACGATIDQVADKLGIPAREFSFPPWHPNGDAPNRLELTWLNEVSEERLTWTWLGWLPDRALAFLDGDPGLGKSVIWANLVARYTRGSYVPLSSKARFPGGKALIIADEDHLASVIVPRLRAAGADLTKVAKVGLRRDQGGNIVPFSVPEDMQRLIEAVKESGAGLVVIDPMSAYLSESIKSFNEASVRRATLPLAILAQEHNVIILAIRHLTKEVGNKKALYRGQGSIGFSGQARSVMLLGEHPDQEGHLVLAQTKGNYAHGRTPSLELKVEPWGEDPDIPAIRWVGRSDLTADDLLSAGDSRTAAPERLEAEQALRHVLEANGPTPAKEVFRLMNEAGHAKRTVERAKVKLGIRSEAIHNDQGKFVGWRWLPPESDRPKIKMPRRRHGNG